MKKLKVPGVPTQHVELKDNPKTILFKMLASTVDYTEYLDKLNQIVRQYDVDEMKDPRNAAVTMTAVDKGLTQYQMLMNMDMRDTKDNGNILDMVSDDDVDAYLGNIPGYLENTGGIEK